MLAQSLAQDERSLAQGCAGAAGFSVGPKQVEQVLSTRCSLWSRCKVDGQGEGFTGPENFINAVERQPNDTSST
jgi:hypothetical protein